MTRHVVHLVKQWLIPGSMPMLLLSVIAGALFLNSGAGGLFVGRLWLTAIAATYWILSLPAMCGWLLDHTKRAYGRVDERFERSGGTVIVVGNGSVHYSDGPYFVDYLTRRSVYAAFEAARVYALVAPDVVIATGGNAGSVAAVPESLLIRDLLVACGVPAGRIAVETESQTTSEQVLNVIAMLNHSDDRRPPIVVTTSAHMPRVVALFQSHGVTVVPATTPELRYEAGVTGWRRWWPSMAALTGSTSAMYEILAGLNDRRRRRIGR